LGDGFAYDFFVSRRGSVATVAQEVDDVLTAAGKKVLVQDYDFRGGGSFVEKMHEGVTTARDLIVLFAKDYFESAYTRKEFTSFEAERLRAPNERHVVILRCDDAPPPGLLADTSYMDLFGVADPAERRRRILDAAERKPAARRPSPRRATFSGVPPRIAGFVGRADELGAIDAALASGGRAAVTQVGRAAVQGMGGVGKTSLAIEYANRYRALYDGIWWSPAATRAELVESLAALAAELGLSPDPNVEKAAKAALRRLGERDEHWLLVYDNVASPDEIAEWLPSSGARVLITSRFSDWGGVADEVSLDVLPIDEAMALLQARAGRVDEAGARSLAEALGRLPLALDHAAAYCKRTQMSFAAYAAKASSLIAAAPRGAPYPRSVAATFGLALDDAAKLCPAAEPLMAFLSFCAPERIPLDLIEGAIDDEQARREALGALIELSLVKAEKLEDGAAAVTAHRLVQAVARERAKANGTAEAAAERVIARLAAIYPDDGYNNPASWPRCAPLTPHLAAVCETQGADGTANLRRADLLSRTSSYYMGRAAYADTRRALDRAPAIREKALGPDHPDTATNLNNLALLFKDLGDLSGARPLFERALAIGEKTLGPEHPAVATRLNNLAGLLQDQGDLAGARPLFERALAIDEKTLGPEHPRTAIDFNNLALLLQAQGDLAGARPLFERALAIGEKTLGPDHPDVATRLNNLASLLKAQGDLAGARPLYERALAIGEKTLGPEHPQTAGSLNNLASLLQAQGDLAGARPLCERALAIFEKALGREHPSTRTVRGNLAALNGGGTG
jgi:tetratricopeptide (TPR) repeat protein